MHYTNVLICISLHNITLYTTFKMGFRNAMLRIPFWHLLIGRFTEIARNMCLHEDNIDSQHLFFLINLCIQSHDSWQSVSVGGSVCKIQTNHYSIYAITAKRANKYRHSVWPTPQYEWNLIWHSSRFRFRGICFHNCRNRLYSFPGNANNMLSMEF